jgi:hypothetical protein
MASPMRPENDRDYDRGFRDGRMDALLPRAGAEPPGDASDTYLAGYVAGAESVNRRVDEAA